MRNQAKTYEQLLAENKELRQRVAALVGERSQAKEAHRANEERFRVSFEEAPVGMVIGVGDQVIAKANHEVCQMIGYAEQELVGQRVTEFIHPEDRELYAPWTERLFAGEIPGFANEKRYLRKDGETLWARTTTHAFRGPNDKVAFALGIVEDITERKRAEVDHIAGLMEDITARTLAQEALERERQSLWQMLKASEHERQMISYDIHDGLAQYLAAAQMHFQGHESLRESSPEEAEGTYRTAVELVRQSYFEARRLISDLRPSVIDEIGLGTAISQPNRLEVLQRVFFHDVLNTAGCIAGYAAHLMQEKRSIEETRDWLVRLSGELVEAIKAQRDLLATESGDLTVQVDMILTKSLLDELRSYYVRNPVTADRGIELGNVWAGIIWTDRHLLLRVLGNMLKNGLEATPQGQTVTMDCLDQGEEVVFAVHNPTVISEQVQLQIFQRSFSTKGQPGRGIGTCSMKLFGEQYLGGKVEFVSRSPEGTTFTLTLPKSRRKR